jgi:hypothetical protein
MIDELGGDVSKVGTPANDQIGIWTGAGTIEGDTGLTYDGSDLSVTEAVKAKNLSFNTETTQSIVAVGTTIATTHGVIRIDSDADYILTATPTLADSVDGDKLMFIYNTGEFTIEIQDENVLTGSNVLLDGGSGIMQPGEIAMFLWSASESAWLVASRVNDNLGNVGFIGKVNEGAGISKGDAVYLTGAVGNLPQVSLADNSDADFSKSDVVGIAQQSKTNGQQITITQIGIITEQNTSAFSAGATIYLDAAGGYTDVHPSGTNAVVELGHVVRSHASLGSIDVFIDNHTGYASVNGTVRHQVVNSNAGTFAGSAYTVVNDDPLRYGSFSIGSILHVEVPSELSIYNSGYGHTNFSNNGNFDHIWFSDITDSHSTTNLVEIMRLTAAGVLQTANIVSSGTISGNDGALTLGAAATTFATTSNFQTITGDGGANTVSTITGGQVGQVLILLFVDGLVTITDTDAHTADTVDLSAAFTSADDTTITLLYDGTSWYETGRSAN